MLRGMRHVVRAVTAVQFALATRHDLLLEVLALRHQLAVLARSNRRFCPSDRLLWLILIRLSPQWRDALLLVQPATVDRWHRDRFDRRWWWRRSQRAGTTAHRFADSRPDWALGRRKSSLGRAADSRRVTKARNRRLRTHGVALPAWAAEDTITDVADVLRESPRPGYRHFGAPVTVRVW